MKAPSTCGHPGLEDICRMQWTTRLLEACIVLAVVLTILIALMTIAILRG